MNIPSIKFVILFSVISLLTSCGLQFKQLTLNNLAETDNQARTGQYSADFAQQAFSEFTSNVIYKDNTSDMWGVEKDDCKDIATTTEVVAEGKKALKVVWDKASGGCSYVGMGFGWDGWRGKQLGDVFPYAAIQMKIRTVSGKMSNLPFVFLLEDYSETQAAVGFNASMAEEMPIAEQWQEITIPLSTFPWEDAELDAFNIKQLIIEMNGTGRVYLDDIEIVPYEESRLAKKPVVSRQSAPSPYKPIKGFLPTDIFVNNIGDVWGIEKDVCKDVKLIADNTHTGPEAIELKWSRSNPGCSWAGVGFGWDSWEPKDLTKIQDQAAIQMYVRAPEGKKLYGLPVVALLEDYDGKVTAGMFNQRYFENFPLTDEWQKVILPLSDFDMEKTPINMASVKQLMLELIGGGELYIDDIGIVPFTKPVEENKEVPEVKDIPVQEQMPIGLFDGGFLNETTWGIVNDECRTFEYKTDETTSKEVLSLSWNEGEHPCNRIEFGTSWTNWRPIDVSAFQNMVSITFALRYEDFPDLSVGFENHDKQQSMLKIKPEHMQAMKMDNWYMVNVPVKELMNANPSYNYSNVRQVLFSLSGNGSALIDKIAMKLNNN